MNTTVEKDTVSQAQTAAPQQYVTPGVNIFETNDAYVLEVEMPGVAREGLEVTVEDNELTLLGRRSAEKASGETLVQESRTRDYRRVFELAPSIDTAKITASIQQGLVTVTLPKAERVKPRRIEVQA